jgi:hypothetical protein
MIENRDARIALSQHVIRVSRQWAEIVALRRCRAGCTWWLRKDPIRADATIEQLRWREDTESQGHPGCLCALAIIRCIWAFV